MKLPEIGQINVQEARKEAPEVGGGAEKFAPILNQELLPATGSERTDPPNFYFYLDETISAEPVRPPMDVAKSAYQANASSLQKYVDDQLLSNPGGDRYNLETRTVESAGKHSFAERVGKDFADAFANARNFFADFLLGAKFCYRDERGEIQEGRKRGLLSTIGDFFKDLGSALSLGAWRPDGEAKPESFWQRVKFSVKKMKEAVVDDFLKALPASVNHMAEDVILTGWNVVETIPDATIGNSEAGERITSQVFDGGQVVIDYVTDVFPTGEGWQRVHSSNLLKLKPPIINNLQKAERDYEDNRWRYIRNTGFRKAIETIGALTADLLTFGLIRWVSSSGSKTRHEE